MKAEIAKSDVAVLQYAEVVETETLVAIFFGKNTADRLPICQDGGLNGFVNRVNGSNLQK